MSELSNLPRQSGAEYPHEGLDNFFTDPNWKQFAIRTRPEDRCLPEPAVLQRQ